jgi:DNA-binding GntR family transcriptional regulator
MARTDVRFRAAYNQMLADLSQSRPGDALPSENEIAARLHVSRTTVRNVLRALDRAGVLRWAGREKRVVRRPTPQDVMAEAPETPARDLLQARFLDWVLRFDVPAGTPLNVAQLAKRFGVPPHAITEFLAGLDQFGLVQRRPRGGWLLNGFTPDYAVELSEFRLVLELAALPVLVDAPDAHPVRSRLVDLRRAHEDLARRIATDYHDFSPLDARFHATLNGVFQNRFAAQFQKVISLIFHYHYQWDKTRERERNAAAIGEHLSIIDAVAARDLAAAQAAVRAHLTTAKETLLGSLRVHGHAAPDAVEAP